MATKQPPFGLRLQHQTHTFSDVSHLPSVLEAFLQNADLLVPLEPYFSLFRAVAWISSLLVPPELYFALLKA